MASRGSGSDLNGAGSAGPSRPRHTHHSRPGLPYSRPRGRGRARAPPVGPRIVRDGLPATQAINVEDDAMRLFQEIEEDVDDAVHGELNEALVAQVEQRARLQASEAQLVHLKATLATLEHGRNMTDDPSATEARLERTAGALASSIQAQRSSLAATKSVVVGLQKKAFQAMVETIKGDVLYELREEAKREMEALVARKVSEALASRGQTS